MNSLLEKIHHCTICQPHLPHKARPVLSVNPKNKIIIIGQAPGSRVHKTGIPWDDPSGERLRNWLGVDRDTFYTSQNFAIMPMGFCYPGKGKSGDLPPRPECAPTWHKQLLNNLPDVQLTLLIGRYAQEYYLGKQHLPTITATVKNFRNYLPTYLPLPHPSPRNNIWFKKNDWFEHELLPELKQRVSLLL